MGRPEDEVGTGEAARILQISPATVKLWKERGTITPVRILPGSNFARYNRADLEQVRAAMAVGNDHASGQKEGRS